MTDPSKKSITLEAKVAFLRQPSSLPDPTWRVEAIETHMSWVFLTEHQAYKLKKPVHFDQLDFRTLQSRRHFCEEEVRLNRRLAPGVYLGVVTLTVDNDGHMQLDGEGQVIDWLVLMRRLAANLMLDHAIRHGEARTEAMDAIAVRLAAFYRDCERAGITPEQYRKRLSDNVLLHGKELAQPDYRLPGDLIDQVCNELLSVLHEDATMFDVRVTSGMIVEGHGDLRPEHICLEQEVMIIDCLEFSRELRTLDTGDEIAFLALECERLGAPILGQRMIDAYRIESGDCLPDRLVAFYQAYRSILRATIAARHLNEEKFRYSPHWRQRAIDYLQLGKQRIPNLHHRPVP